MYTLVSAVLKKRGRNTTWENTDISNMLFNDLLNNYSSGFIQLSNPYLYHPIFVTLDELRSSNRYPNINVKFPLWLQAVGNITINGSEQEPNYIKNYVYAADAFHCGFDVNRTLTGINTTDSYPIDMLTNIKISKQTAELEILIKRTLTTVNGLLHIHTPLDDGILIQDGAKSLDISNKNHVGLISFGSVGDITMVSIKQNMIGKDNSNYDLADGMYIHLGKSLVGKTLMFSIAGFLHVVDDSFSIINEEMGIIRVNPRKLDLTKRLSIARKYIDISELGLSQSVNFPEAIITDEVYSDRVLKNIFLMIQTFAIIVDATNVSTKQYMLDDIQTPGVYEHFQAGVYPFIDVHGRMQEYVCLRNDVQFQIQVDTSENGIMHYTWGDLTDQRMVNGKIADGDFYQSPGAFLEICFTSIST